MEQAVMGILRTAHGYNFAHIRYRRFRRQTYTDQLSTSDGGQRGIERTSFHSSGKIWRRPRSGKALIGLHVSYTGN